MKQEDKELFIKDLCSRLPYGVICDVEGQWAKKLLKIDYDRENTLFDFGKDINGYQIQVYISEIKPYLFPMSSMTEEQGKEYQKMVTEELMEILDSDSKIIKPEYKYIDWLNSHHFDYRGLIGKGLAIDASNLGIYEN